MTNKTHFVKTITVYTSIPVFLLCADFARATDAKTCQLILDFALSGRKASSPSFTSGDVKACGELVQTNTTTLRDAVTGSTDPDKFIAISGVDFPKPPFLSFKAGDSMNTTILTYRRALAALQESLHSTRILTMTKGNLRSAALNKAATDVRYAKTKGTKSGTDPKKAKDDTNTDLEAALSSVEVASGIVLQLMDQRNLLDPFNALLQTYIVAVVAAGNTQVPSALTTQVQTNQVKAAGFLNFESEHFHTNSNTGPDLSFGGRFGVGPVETLDTVAPAPQKPSPTGVYTLHQNAFIWDLNARLNWRLGRKAELSLPMFRFGETILMDDSVSVSAQPTTTAMPIANNRGKSAWFWEAAPEYRLYPKLLATIEDSKKFLEPSFSFSTGYRRDSRFDPFPGSGIESFANPTKRWFIRSFVTLTKVAQKDFSSTTTANPFDVSIGVEWDTTWGTSGGKAGPGVPDATRIFINASIDLVKVFTKQGSQGQQNPGQ